MVHIEKEHNNNNKENILTENGDIFVSAVRIGQILGACYNAGTDIDKKYIKEFKDEGMPFRLLKNQPLYPIKECIVWYAREKDMHDPKTAKMLAETTRIKKNIELQELEIKKAKGEYVSVAELSNQQAELIKFFIENFSSFVKRQVDKRLKKELDNFAHEFFNIELKNKLEDIRNGVDIDSYEENE